MASFREIEVLDVRPLPKSVHENIKFRQINFMKQILEEATCHVFAIEHFGLGRYTDKIDVDGHNKGITNLVDLVSYGRLYISFPIGKKDEVHLTHIEYLKSTQYLITLQ